jgi:Tol biopolymer transport system component
VADGASDLPSISADGRYVAFTSMAENMTSGSVLGRNAVYVRDRATKATTLVSVAPDGAPANANSDRPSISGDGRYVAFHSNATNLAAGATTGAFNVYVRDMTARTTRCVSLAADGSAGVGDSLFPAISANGRYVAFQSTSSNIVEGDTNDEQDILLFDTTANTTTLVSVASDGGSSNTSSSGASVSGDGRYVAFVAGDGNFVLGDENGANDIFVRDTVAKTTAMVSVGPGGVAADNSSSSAALSADGRHIAFQSRADNLVSGDGNGTFDVFERDLDTNTTTRVSVANDGGEAAMGGFIPSISADGRFVAFISDATNLVSGDTNGVRDVFVRDTTANTTERVSVAAGGLQAGGQSFNEAMSADGGSVAFVSEASNLVPGDVNGTRDIFVRDRAAGTTDIASVATRGSLAPSNGESYFASVSGDGRYVAFYSLADNLVPGDTSGVEDVFVRDTWTNTTERVSVATDGAQSNGASRSSNGGPAISADGRYVAFVSSADNLVANDTNGAPDVFVRDRVAHTTVRVSVSSDGTPANSDANRTPYSSCGISATGRYVGFVTSASNLVPNDANNAADVFLRDTVAGITERVDVRADGSESREGAGGAVPSISADGRYVVFAGPSDLFGPDNGVSTINAVIRDRVANTTTRQVSAPLDSAAATNGSFDCQISADGKSMVFATVVTPAPPNGQWKDGIFLEDLATGDITWVSRPPGGDYPSDSSIHPSISADGQTVAFVSSATNLVAGGANSRHNVYLWERATEKIALVSQATDGGPSDGDSGDEAISGDGRYVGFDSLAANLVPNDTNGANDVFERGPFSGPAGAFSFADVPTALRVAGGLAGTDAPPFGSLNAVASETGTNVIDIVDALRIARRAAGLD